jgi:hypothetical protein
VRGDSLRDLYAKTLALLGLGVLAGAGALVDYWPTGITMPDAGSALVLPPIAHAIPVNPAVLRTSPIEGGRDTSLASREMVRTAEVVPASVSRHGLATLPVVITADLRVGSEVGITAPAVRMAALTSTPTTDAIQPRADSSYEPYMLGADHAGQYVEPATLMTDDESDGFISGAFKKTGTSIVKTGVRTGASIVDAVRVVGGAVRRALPN